MHPERIIGDGGNALCLHSLLWAYACVDFLASLDANLLFKIVIYSSFFVITDGNLQFPLRKAKSPQGGVPSKLENTVLGVFLAWNLSHI